jgi:hypothetical protein
VSDTEHRHHEGQDVESELLLEDLGYKPELQRGLNILGNLALTLSDITPTASLLVVGTAVIATAGTGSLWAYLIGGFIGFLAPRSDRYWSHLSVPEHELAAAAAERQP